MLIINMKMIRIYGFTFILSSAIGTNILTGIELLTCAAGGSGTSYYTGVELNNGERTCNTPNLIFGKLFLLEN